MPTKKPPQTVEAETERITDQVVAFLKALGRLAVYALFLTVGYDLFAPLVHAPLANPLQALGLLLSLDVLRVKVLGR